MLFGLPPLRGSASKANPTTSPEGVFLTLGRERAQRAVGPKRVIAALIAAMVATALLAQAALADATPVQLILLYMPNVSNMDTPKATGIAELVMLEGEVRIKTADLPRLDGDQRYVAWVVNSGTNEFQRLGAFNTAESTGAVAFETVLPDAIPNKHWNLLLITVEDHVDADKPSSRHSIAGLFPSADNAPLPIVLPNTGGDPNADSTDLQDRPVWLQSAGLASLTFVLGGAAGYAAGRRQQ